MVDVGLQVTLGQVGALASRHNAAHEQGATLALLDALHRVCAVVEGEAEHREGPSVRDRQQEWLLQQLQYNNNGSEKCLTLGTFSLLSSHEAKHSRSRKRVCRGSEE